MSTRRTRAHPSPGGLKSLPIDPPKRTRRQPTKPKQAPAAAPEGVISSENTITIDHRPSPSPAPPTSRSQSPHILESDSQSAVIESRSSSPPTDDKGHWTRSQTASTSPQAKRPTTQLPKRKSKKATPKTTTKNTRKRTRSQRTAPAPTVIGSFPDDNEAEAAGSVSAEENIVVEDRSSQALEPFEPEPSAEKTPVRKFAKGRQSRNQSSDINGHLRSGERRPVQRKSTDFLQAGDTSDSDLADEERAPKRTKLEANKYSPRNSSSRKPHSRQPSATNSPLNQGAKQLPVTAETSRSLVLANPDGTQVAHPRRDLSQLIGQRDSPSKHLTPRSMRRIFSTPKAPVDDGDRQGPTKVIGTLPKDGDQRLQLWMDAYKIKPESLTSYRRAARAKVNSDSGDDDDEAADSGDEYEQLTRSLPPQRSDRRIFPRKRIPFDISEGPGGNNTVVKDQENTRQSTTNSICQTLTVSSNISQEKYILTDPALIGFINQAISWFGADESRKVPSAKELATFLEGSAAPSTPRPPTGRQLQIAAGVAAMQGRTPEVAENTDTEEQLTEGASRVDEDENRSLVSESTQAEMLGPSEDEDDAMAIAALPETANEGEETNLKSPQTEIAEKSQKSSGWMSPWSGVSAVANIFATPLKFFGGRSQSATKSTNRRVVGAATQPRKPSQRPIQHTPSRRPRTIAQTERPRRHGDTEKPPIHLRGLVSPARIAEIHRKQDEAQRKREAEMAEARRKMRQAATVEEEDEGSELPSIEVDSQAQPGQKRKRQDRPPRTPPRSAPGTFRVPSPSSSSEDDYSDEEPATPTPAQALKSIVTPSAVEKRSLMPSEAQIKSTPVYDPAFGTEERARPYTGKIFAQPKSVQANINDGKFPLSPRSDIHEAPPAASSLTTSTPTTQNIFEAQRLTKSNLEKLNEPTGLGNETSKGKPIVFKAPSDSGSDSDEEEDSGTKSGTSALQTKKWTQSPPPKPRPSNASLPKKPSTTAPETSPSKTADAISQQQTGDLARVRGAAEKFKPKQPSRLREVTQMSPNQVQEQEHKFLANAIEIESTIGKFDPAVMEALNSIPESDLHDIVIPFDYGQHVLEPFVEREVRMLVV